MKREMIHRAGQRTFYVLLPVLMLCFGLWSWPISFFAPGFSNIPGDLGDARFNNYILEHFYQFVTGVVKSYWDAPFMYPYKNVIALSDNLLGTAPLYALFRVMEFDRESSFQLWIIAMFAMNYVCCFVALRMWSRNTVLSACGAFIFAFGIYHFSHLNHAQMMPRFMIPLAFVWLWHWLELKQVKYFVLVLFGIVFQFYCGIQLGFMLIYSLLFLFLSHLFIHRDFSLFQRFRDRKYSTISFLSVLLAGVSMALLMSPYIEASKDVGMRDYEWVVGSLPRPVGYFFTHNGASSWLSLTHHSVDAFPRWWDNFHFVGAIPWLAISIAPFIAFRKRVELSVRRPLKVLLLALVLSTLFCMNFNGFTLYKVFWAVPGFSALRALDRIMNVQILFFVLIMVHVFRSIQLPRPIVLMAGLTLPFLVLLDNRVDASKLKTYDKEASQRSIKKIEQRILSQFDNNHPAIAYVPYVGALNIDEWAKYTYETQLSAMLAAQALHIPIVNGYTGSNPGNYKDFADKLDRRTLERWCAYNSISMSEIQVIESVNIPVLNAEWTRLKAGNGTYISVDISRSKEGMVVADRHEAANWETFRMLDLENGRVAFMAHNGNFLSAELAHEKGISASAPDLGDFGMFDVQEIGDGKVVLRAFNDRFVVIDPNTLELFAVADSINSATSFELLRIDP